MVRSSTLTEEPLVTHIEEAICETEGYVAMTVHFNPAGMAMLIRIDPDARFGEMFYHSLWAKSAMHFTNMTKPELNTLDGFAKLYEYIVDEKGMAAQALITGFPYYAVVHESSPLVGWFNVMKGVSNG
jgi:hypothetical protein